MRPLTRREWLSLAPLGAVAAATRAAVVDEEEVVRQAWDFIVRCRRDDGGYAPSPDPSYGGNSDTKFSDLAAVTYAAVLARTFGRELPRPESSVAFVRL